MLCAPLAWQYAELPSSASDAVLCSVLVRGTSNQIEIEKMLIDEDEEADEENVLL